MTHRQNEFELCTQEQSMTVRPWWQRIVYPIIGGILVILGIIGWVIPVLMGFPLIIVGIPLLVCFHPKLELKVRRYMHHMRHKLVEKVKLAIHHRK